MPHARPSIALVVVMLASLVHRRRRSAAGLETLIMPGKVSSAARQARAGLLAVPRPRGSQPAGRALHGLPQGRRRGRPRPHGLPRTPARHRQRAVQGLPLGAPRPRRRHREAQPAGRSTTHAPTSRWPARTPRPTATAATSPARSTGRRPSACVDCHRADDPHGGKLGTDCGSLPRAAELDEGPLRSRQDEVRAARRPSRTWPARPATPATATRERRRSARPATRRTTCTAAPAARTAPAATRPSAWKTSKFDHAKETRFRADRRARAARLPGLPQDRRT